MRKQMSDHLGSELKRVSFDKVEGEANRTANQAQRFLVRVLRAYIVELEVVQANTVGFYTALCERTINEVLADASCIGIGDGPKCFKDSRRRAAMSSGKTASAL